MGPVLVCASPAKAAAAEAAERIRPRLDRDFTVAAVDLSSDRDLSRVDAKWALVLGGDGAMLSVTRRMGDHPIPTVGVNFGRLGFLTELEFEQLDDALDRIREGKVHVQERMRLTATLGDREEHAVNDVVVTARRAGALFRVSAKIAGREALRYQGDGVVIATPTGSTAYSLSAGGPILDPELRATVITPLCAHALSHRPLVIPAKQRIELYLRKGDPAGTVRVDGQEFGEIARDQRLVVRQARKPFLLIRTGLRSYYGRLRKILRWGEQPKYTD